MRGARSGEKGVKELPCSLQAHHSPNFHAFVNPEALQTPYFRDFMKMSPHGHDEL